MYQIGDKRTWEELVESVFGIKTILLKYHDNTLQPVSRLPAHIIGCRGIVFTHGVWIGEWAGVGRAGSGKKFFQAIS